MCRHTARALARGPRKRAYAEGPGTSEPEHQRIRCLTLVGVDDGVGRRWGATGCRPARRNAAAAVDRRETLLRERHGCDVQVIVGGTLSATLEPRRQGQGRALPRRVGSIFHKFRKAT